MMTAGLPGSTTSSYSSMGSLLSIAQLPSTLKTSQNGWLIQKLSRMKKKVLIILLAKN